MLKNQLKELFDYAPNLNIVSSEEEIVIEGEYCLDATIQGLNLKETFKLKLIINKEFPKVLPKVYDLSSKMKSFHHINPDGEFCLSVFIDSYLKIQHNPTLKNFFVLLVVPFLYSYTFFNKYNEMPFGERKHGLEGIIEFYKEYLQAENMEQFANLFVFVLNNYKYRGHLSCPCGSNKPTRNCHADTLKRIFEQKGNKAYAMLLTKDMKELIRNVKSKN